MILGMNHILDFVENRTFRAEDPFPWRVLLLTFVLVGLLWN